MIKNRQECLALLLLNTLLQNFFYRFVAVRNFDCAVINVCYRVLTNVDSLQSRILSQSSLQS
jgi:hypothetical protein